MYHMWLWLFRGIMYTIAHHFVLISCCFKWLVRRGFSFCFSLSIYANWNYWRYKRVSWQAWTVHLPWPSVLIVYCFWSFPSYVYVSWCTLFWSASWLFYCMQFHAYIQHWGSHWCNLECSWVSQKPSYNQNISRYYSTRFWVRPDYHIVLDMWLWVRWSLS